MTIRKHFKTLVRERMTKTGESYASARRQVLKQAPTQPSDPASRWHYPGSVPATTALRVLLAAAGVRAPHTGAPFTEEMLFGIAGGVGIGVAAFHYAKENHSSFFVAGRHLWFDDEAYLQRALERFGLQAAVQETAGAKAADRQLRDLLAAGPCVAWVDMAHLPHRALPPAFSGGGYHVVPVYRIDEDAKAALIGDLTDEPITIPLGDLATARSRIKKQAHRLLSVTGANPTLDLAQLVRAGLRVSHQALTAKPGKGPLAMSTLESLRRWHDRLAGSKDKESWEKLFPPGPNLWRGLISLYLFIEMYGTGGGLCRSLMADFLAEAGAALGEEPLLSLAGQYAALGREWSALADAALPGAVAPFRQAKEQYARYHELFTASGSIDEKRAVWKNLDELAASAKTRFPLAAAQCADLRADLQARLKNIVAAEEKALADMARILSE
jgi:hypothetical protein